MAHSSLVLPVIFQFGAAKETHPMWMCPRLSNLKSGWAASHSFTFCIAFGRRSFGLGKQWQTNGNQQSSSMTPWPNAILDTVCDSPPNPVCCWNSTPSFGLFNPSDCCRAVCAMGCNGSPGHPCWALPLQQVPRSNSQHRSTSINIQQVCSTSHLPI